MSTVSAFQGAKSAAYSALDPQKPVQHIVSITNFQLEAIGHKANQVVTATREVAAHMIATGTHRLATPEEAAAYDAQEQKAQEAHERQKPLPMTFESMAKMLTSASQPKPQPIDNKGGK